MSHERGSADQFIARANIDHYVSLLNRSDLTPRKRDTIVKLLIAQEDKLGHDLEQLEFAKIRTAQSWDRVHHLRKLRDGFSDGSTERAHAETLVEIFETTLELFERFCRQLRGNVNSSRL